MGSVMNFKGGKTTAAAGRRRLPRFQEIARRGDQNTDAAAKPPRRKHGANLASLRVGGSN
jgi:hypothetical protein